MTHYCHIHMSATCPCGIFMAFEYRNPRFNTWFPIFDSSSEQETATFLADYQKIGEIETDIEYEKKYSGYYTPLPH